MKRLLSIAAGLAATVASTAAFAYAPAPAPKTFITADHGLFQLGRNTPYANSISQILREDTYWYEGECTEDVTCFDDSDGNPIPYSCCDDLRFGYAVHAGPDCADSGEFGPLTYFVAPAEESGIVAETEFDPGNSGGTCEDYEWRNHDSGLTRLWHEAFPNLVTTSSTLDVFTASPTYRQPTDAELEVLYTAYDENGDPIGGQAHVNWYIIDNLPGESGTTSGPVITMDADYGRMVRAITMAENMLYGEIDSVPMIDPVTMALTTGSVVGLPPFPTWVITEEPSDSRIGLFAGLVAGAGGSAFCQHRDDDGDWNEISEYRSHMATHGADFQDDFENLDGANWDPRYRCSETGTVAGVGALTGADDNTSVRCHLSGPLHGSCRSDTPETNLLGIFKCIRQLPYGTTAATLSANDPDGDVVIRVCPLGADQDDLANPECTYLSEAEGEIEFVDPARTMFIITDLQNCNGGTIGVFECSGECDTGEPGRCGPGEYRAVGEACLCLPLLEAMPEICNGLDDDCDGAVDNFGASWEKSQFSDLSLPVDHIGLECNLLDVCVCPNGDTDTHAGGGYCEDGDNDCEEAAFQEYLDAWDPVCQCGENLAPDSPAPREDTQFSNESACSAVATDAVPASFLGLLVLGFAGLFRRRM